MKTHRTTLQLTLLVMVTLALAAGFVLANHPAPVSAAGGDLDRARSKYPAILGTRLDSCSLCHSNTPALNPYGSAYRSNGRNANAFGVIEGLDSDGDGFTNLQEITALTFPGNANDKPAAAPTATRQPTNTPTRLPTNTPTQAPTRTPTMTPTNTPTRAPTNTPTNVPTNPPTSVPTNGPTNTPTNAPTNAPTATPTNPPTQIPTNTAAPTQQPTSTPTLPPVPTATAKIPPDPTATAINPPKPTQTAVPGTLVLNPSADTYVSREGRDRRAGNGDTLLVNSKPETVSFLRFEMKGLDEEKVAKAILRLYANTSSSDGISAFHAGDSNWDEDRISDRALRFGGRSARMRSISGGDWIEIDVTSLVHGKRSVSFALTTGGQQVSFASRETGDHAPQLEITVDGHGDRDDDHDEGDDDEEGEGEDD